jgi:hypothetical protein
MTCLLRVSLAEKFSFGAPLTPETFPNVGDVAQPRPSTQSEREKNGSVPKKAAGSIPSPHSISDQAGNPA